MVAIQALRPLMNYTLHAAENLRPAAANFARAAKGVNEKGPKPQPQPQPKVVGGMLRENGHQQRSGPPVAVMHTPVTDPAFAVDLYEAPCPQAAPVPANFLIPVPMVWFSPGAYYEADADATAYYPASSQQQSRELPKRTGSSRRQRQRAQRRQEAGAAPQLQIFQMQMAMAAPMPPHAQVHGYDHGFREESPMLYPPTPFSTPPSSPRANFSASSWEQQPETNPPPSPPLGPSSSAVSVAGESSEWVGRSLLALGGSDAEAVRMLAQLSDGDRVQRHAAITKVAAAAWPMALTASGSRALQKAVDVADKIEQGRLLEPLRGHVPTAASSPHGNHVLQKCIQSLPTERVRFILEEMEGNAETAAKSRYGCRVLERLIEHFPSDQTATLVAQVLHKAEILSRHCFGNFVIQHILVHGTDSQRRQVVSVLEADASRLARHRVASHVMKTALINCAPEEKGLLVQVLSADADDFSEMMHHHCGSFVAREVKRATAGGLRD
jgi:hypothetical protein